MRKILAMLLAVVMVLGLFTACGNTTPETTEPKPPEGTNPPATTPVEDETVDFVNAPDLSGQTIRILTGGGWSEADFATVLPKFKQIEELTGCTIIWEAPKTDWESVLQTRLAGSIEEAPDIIFNGGTIASTNTIDSELIVDVSEYFDIAPNMAAWFAANPAIAQMCTYLDGGIYTLPGDAWATEEDYYAAEKHNGDNGRGDNAYWFRGDIAAELGYTEVPKTLEEFEALLYAVKTAYPDMIPFATRNVAGGDWCGSRNFSASFGLHFNFQIDNVKVFYYPDENGVVQYELFSEGGIKWMETMARWYADGIMMDTADWDAYYAGAASGQIFSAYAGEVWTYEELLQETDPDAYFMFMPAVPAEGYEVAVASKPMTYCNTQVVDNGEERVEAALKFLDFAFYSDYGIYSEQAGVMGEGWDFGENGEFVVNMDYVRTIVNDGVSVRESGADIGYWMPTVHTAEVANAWLAALDAVYAENGTARIPNAKTFESYTNALKTDLENQEPRFDVNFYATEEDQEFLNTYAYEAYKYAALYSAAVIKGEKDLANVQTELIDPMYNDLHLQELIDIYQKYYDAAQSN